METTIIKPFLKWAGGKSQLLTEIEKFYPFNDKITKYAEPFVGGGAVLFDILNKYDLEKIYISDINLELINTYIVIRDHIDELVDLLSLYQSEYLTLESQKRKLYYLEKRTLFNHLISQIDDKNNIEKAALMIFLNKTCFNGLFRVNKQGLFNVPIGSYKNPLICNKANLKRIGALLLGVEVRCGDYQKCADSIVGNTFVYIDSPYRSLTSTASFTSYSENEFYDKQQISFAGLFMKFQHGAQRLLQATQSLMISIIT